MNVIMFLCGMCFGCLMLIVIAAVIVGGDKHG